MASSYTIRRESVRGQVRIVFLTIACYVFSGLARLFLMPGPRQLTCSGVGKCILIVCAKHTHTNLRVNLINS